MQFHRKKPSIINDKQVQTALSLGYVKHTENQILQFLPEQLGKSLNDKSKVDIYQDALNTALKKANEFDTGEDPETLKTIFLTRN
jgi:Zn-finger domain-containing protein